jgi:hypothetical protein
MSDIFISYASEDRDRVRSLAHALEKKGWSVWWDRRVPAGKSFDEVILEALKKARSVIVVWTNNSVQSTGVKNEARNGLRRGILFPVMLLNEVKIPPEFEQLQAARLIDWQPNREHAGFDRFVQGLAQVIGAPSNDDGHQSAAAEDREPVPARSGEDRPNPSTVSDRSK